MKTIHRTTRSTMKGIIALTALLTVVFTGLTFFERIHGTHGTILAGMAMAEADDAGQQDTETKATQEPNQDDGSVNAPVLDHKTSGIFANTSMDSLAQSLKMKEKELKKREEALKEEEKRLEALRAEVEQNLARMEQTLKKMESLAIQADANKEEAVNQWVGIYQTMEPADVAKIIEGVDEDFAIRLLSAMVPKKAGEVLSAIPPEASIKLSKYLTENK